MIKYRNIKIQVKYKNYTLKSDTTDCSNTDQTQCHRPTVYLFNEVCKVLTTTKHITEKFHHQIVTRMYPTWNSLPPSIRDLTLSAGTFATLLKTYLFV